MISDTDGDGALREHDIGFVRRSEVSTRIRVRDSELEGYEIDIDIIGVVNRNVDLRSDHIINWLPARSGSNFTLTANVHSGPFGSLTLSARTCLSERHFPKL